MVDTKKALEVARYPWRVEQGGRYSLPSINEVGYVVGTIKELVDEVEELKLDVDWLLTPTRKRHEALLQAAKDHLDVAGCFESEPLCEAIEACEAGKR